MRLLLVDDDRGLLELIQVTFDDVDARSSQWTRRQPRVVQSPVSRPMLIVLDVMLPASPASTCAGARRSRRTTAIPIMLLRFDRARPAPGRGGRRRRVPGETVGPLQLVAVVEQLHPGPDRSRSSRRCRQEPTTARLLLYAETCAASSSSSGPAPPPPRPTVRRSAHLPKRLRRKTSARMRTLNGPPLQSS